MWIILMLFLAAAALAASMYLACRIGRFPVIGRIASKIVGQNTRNQRLLSFFLGLLSLLLLFGAVWLFLGFMNAIVMLIHLTLFWLLFDLFFFLLAKLRKKGFRQSLAGLFALSLTAIYLAVGFFLSENVTATSYSLVTGKELGDLRIVQFADAHIGTSFDGEGLGKYVEEINALSPDLVLITGDFVDESTAKEDMIAACRALGKLSAPYGVYFSFGNHDEGYDPNRPFTADDLIGELEKNRVTVLRDESVLIDNRFYVIGRRDRSEERANMETLLAGLDRTKYQIVLDHQPSDYGAQAESGVDLVLSGHTHGGQLLPINRVGEWLGVNDATYGLKKRGDTTFIVTSGIAGWALRFKTGCRSEYVVIDIQET